MTEPFRDFSELVLYAQKGRDYRILITDRSAAVTVAAIHGGVIEPLTGELAEAVAAADCNLYLMRGLVPGEANRFRIPVTRYDDVRLTSLLDRSVAGISIHGAPGEDAVVHLGGRNRRLCGHVQDALQRAEFRTAGPTGAQAAHSPARFVNRPAQGGVQLEFSLGLRRMLARNPLDRVACGAEDPCWTDAYDALIGALRCGLVAYLAALDGDLGLAMEHFEEATREARRVLPSADDGHGGACHRTY